MIPSAIDLSPHRYVKVRGGFSRLSELLTPFGSDLFLFYDPLIRRRLGDEMMSTFRSSGYRVREGCLQRECCEKEGSAFVATLKTDPPDVVIGVGGGKALDLAKWIAWRLGVSCVALPTSAATCAATTPVSVMYTPDGRYRETIMTAPPGLTLVDPSIHLTQPPRLLAAGMADAMAKWLEARGKRKIHHKRILPASALSLARLGYEFLTRQGTRGIEDLTKGNWTPSLSEVIDINLFLTGLISTLGGEAVRVSAAHAFQDAFCDLGTQRDILHGEWVAFGLIIQLVLEKTPDSLIRRHLILFRRWGMPLGLETLGLRRDDGVIEEGVQRMMAPESPLHNLMVPVRAEEVRAAIDTADRLTRA